MSASPGTVRPARRGARRLVDVPSAVIREVEAGAATVNHVEQMAIDMGALLANLFPELAHQRSKLTSPQFLTRMRAGARILYNHFGDELFEGSAAWSSDTARGWAAFAVPLTQNLLSDQLRLTRRYADDDHFAVREWAWLGVRPSVISDPQGAVDELVAWTVDRSPFVRRFSCEALRPHGVWSAHIPLLKSNPELALPILDPLVADQTRYVQDSVANWLNDASKSQPAWVLGQTERWAAQHGPSTRYVLRRAVRTIPGATS